MALQVKVCALEEIEEGVISCFEVPGVAIPVLVTKVDGIIIAGTSMCPHEDVSLKRATLKSNTIVCRAHGYAFHLQTGVCSHDPNLRWKTYKTDVVGDYLFVQLL